MNRLLRRENGVASVELALVTPVFLVLFLSALELGHMIYYSTTIEKGMRSAVTYAGRNPHPLTQPVIDNTVNLAKTGSFDPAADYLVKGYANGGTVSVTERSFTKTMNGGVEDITVSVVVLTVDVPYVPLLPLVTENFLNMVNPSINLTHEQAIIGD